MAYKLREINYYYYYHLKVQYWLQRTMRVTSKEELDLCNSKIDYYLGLTVGIGLF